MPSDRQRNASERCGVAWLSWPLRGDGAGYPNDLFLGFRNLLPSPSFEHAIQNTKVPGDEAAVMGDYLPTSTCSTMADFEARGCHKS